METIEPILAAQPFFQGLHQRHIQELAACASRSTSPPGSSSAGPRRRPAAFT